jgi:hypothetical protein
VTSVHTYVEKTELKKDISVKDELLQEVTSVHMYVEKAELYLHVDASKRTRKISEKVFLKLRKFFFAEMANFKASPEFSPTPFDPNSTWNGEY